MPKLKVAQFFNKLPRKVATSVFTSNWCFQNIPKSLPYIWPTFVKKNCHKKLSKSPNLVTLLETKFKRLTSDVVTSLSTPWPTSGSSESTSIGFVAKVLSDDKLVIRPKHNIYTLCMILFGLFDLILIFVCQIKFVTWIVKQKIDSKWKLVLKVKDLNDWLH